MKYEKLDHGLLAALDLLENDEPLSEFNAFARVMAVGAGPDGRGPLVAVVFLHARNGARLEDIDSIGETISGGRGGIYSATIDLRSLEALSHLDAVESITVARFLRPQVDRALEKTGIQQFRAARNLSGVGAVIGIIDSGIDAMASAVAGRIDRIWDQTMPGPGVPEGPYGMELRGPQMFSSQDDSGHGTHVAAIAAGAHHTYGGVAPGATLVVVKTSHINARVADAVAYVFRVADDLGMPAVVNLSLGAHSDAHDGSDELSRQIDAECGPGHIVCAAAGNDGYQDIHAHGIVEPGAITEIFFRVPPLTINIATINIWYSGSSSLETSVQSPNDYFTLWQAPIASGKPQVRYRIPEGRVRVTTSSHNAYTSDRLATVELTPHTYGQAVAHGVWRVRLRNTDATRGVFDAWVSDDFGQGVTFSGNCVDAGMKIGSPGCAASAVTVASFTTRTEWNDQDGTLHEVALAPDEVSDFSGAGPLRDGRLKPDVTAPGAMIVSARSRHAQVEPEFVVEPGWIVRAGTSMAVPVITGIVALLLQRESDLTPDQVKARLRDCSAIPGNPPQTYDVRWGYGLIDMGKLDGTLS